MMATDIAPGDLTPEQLDTLARAAGPRGMKNFGFGPIGAVMSAEPREPTAAEGAPDAT